MFSTLKPTNLTTNTQDVAPDVLQGKPAASAGGVRSAFHQVTSDMRGDSEISVARADFSANVLGPQGGASSNASLDVRLQQAHAWFAQACQAQVLEAKFRLGRGADDPHLVGESGCVDLMEHALAIAKVLKIEMPGLMTALIRPGLADTARRFAREVADGLDDYVLQVEGQKPGSTDARKADYLKATAALRSDWPNLNGIWYKNPLFLMTHLDDKNLLYAKIEQYTAKQKEAVAEVS